MPADTIASASKKRSKAPKPVRQNNAANNVLLAVIALSFAVVIGVLMAKQMVLGLGLTGLIVGLVVVLICLLNAEAGLYITLGYSFLISFFNRLIFDDSLPVGVFADMLIGVTFLGFYVRREAVMTEVRSFASKRVGALLLIVYAYTLLEIFNPAGPSLNGAIPVVRKIAGILMLVLTAYQLFSSTSAIKRFIRVLFFFCSLVAIYACVQEWVGFFDFEMNWLRSDPRRFRMTFVNGGARRMSFFLDAVSLSIVMAVASVFFTGVAVAEKKYWRKAVLFTGVLLMLLAMGYSLTRTSNVMFLAGIVLFLLLTMNKVWSKVFAIAGMLIFLILLYGPFYGNNQLAQFRQTFKGGTKDPSYIVREVNRKSIQPYIYRHPFGGGLSTTGEEGLMYHPGHRLAGFPPDSGYLKKALELGWVGFGLILFLYFSVLQTGIKGYFSVPERNKKMLIAACTAALFAFYVGDFSQVAIGQITDVVVYYPLIAIILRLSKQERSLITNEPLTV